ncbi:hypothetical protein [Archangium sp.]|uniref:hypothetical protein n=1 Tax=Archangium sp. TaxID=1872627 RepID=UPI002D70E887|nr:hypothetical protein [Archangium sp.]HYO51734.1 hypothetical protein [Archangium sp.]
MRGRRNTLAGPDAIIEILLGLAELLTTIIAVSLGVSEQEELGVIGFRVGNWLLRGVQKVFDGADNTLDGQSGQPSAQSSAQSKRVLYAKLLSLGTCALITALDINEGLYLAYEATGGD